MALKRPSMFIGDVPSAKRVKLAESKAKYLEVENEFLEEGVVELESLLTKKIEQKNTLFNRIENLQSFGLYALFVTDTVA